MKNPSEDVSFCQAMVAELRIEAPKARLDFEERRDRAFANGPNALMRDPGVAYNLHWMAGRADRMEKSLRDWETQLARLQLEAAP